MEGITLYDLNFCKVSNKNVKKLKGIFKIYFYEKNYTSS